jgi:pSer/pThr/pTyr-binding forkhead associated (FHA) protein
MIKCPSCGATNESHYKFCLGCGAEITSPGLSAKKAEVEKPVKLVEAKDEPDALKEKLEAMKARRHSESPALIPSVAPTALKSEPEEASFESIHTHHDEDATNVESLPSVMDGLRFKSGTGGVFGSTADAAAMPPGHSTDAQGLGGLDTVRLSEEIKSVAPEPKTPLSSDAPKTGSPETTMEVSTIETNCPSCGAIVMEGFRFCGSCGAPMKSREDSPGESAPAPLMELVFIHPSGEEGERLALHSTDVILGRSSESGLLKSDPHLSPEHARFTIEDGALYCEDLGSFNGVFTRLMSETVIEDGGMFRIGQQLFLFESQSKRTPDYTKDNMSCIPFGSPINEIWGRLSSVCGPQVYADQWILKTPEVYLGREQGTVTFPDDVFVSGTHCRIKYVEQSCRLEDLGSTNGTYVKRDGKFKLEVKDFVLLGQQLFRVEYPQ